MGKGFTGILAIIAGLVALGVVAFVIHHALA